MSTLDTSKVAGAVLSAAQTGNAVSTNVADRFAAGAAPERAALLTLVTTIGATPTVTIDIQGSADNVDWWNVPYADVGTPTNIVVASLVITTAATFRKILQPNAPWRYLRLNYTANTNVTTTATLYAY